MRAAEHRENEQRYRNLAEAIPQIVWTASADGAITYFNRRWYEYSGQTLDAARGWGWTAAMLADDAERWRDGLARREVFERECRLRRRDGEIRWHLCRAVLEVDGAGAIVAWLGTFTDCDDLKRALDTAERAVHARDEFLSIASHELRTPLSTLQLRLTSLHGDLAGGALGSKVDATLRQSTRLVGLVENLFDFSRISSGTLALRRQRFDLAEAARDAVERLRELAARAAVVVRVESDGVVAGEWDRLRVDQVIENLVSNAIKYAPNRPVTVTIGARDGSARIAVTDHGPGIARADLSRVFGPFERASSTVSYGGLGLGLYIAREYTAAHGGTIAVDSVPDERTTFTVTLPLARSPT
jgi:PAS domain S-box-containing protein